MACSQGTSAILTLGGVDPRTGRPYVSYETVKGLWGTCRTRRHKSSPAASPNTMNTR